MQQPMQYEKKNKDCKQSGYGTKDVRLSKDAIKDFDCCSLTLQPCMNPVTTPEGWIFEKEAILEYILHKRLEKLMKDFEKQKERDADERRQDADESKQSKLLFHSKILSPKNHLFFTNHQN